MCLLCSAAWVYAESEEEFYTHLLQLKLFLLTQQNILCLCKIVCYLIEGKCVISVSFQRVLFLQHRDAGLHLNAVTVLGQRGAVLQQSLAAMAGVRVIKQNAVCPTGFLDSHCCCNRGFFKIHCIICIYNPCDPLQWRNHSYIVKGKKRHTGSNDVNQIIIIPLDRCLSSFSFHISSRLLQGANGKSVPKATTHPNPSSCERWHNEGL